jgi:hypothetical protein
MKYKTAFWVILVSGLFLRLYHVWTASFAYVDGDTSTIWLMAKHMLKGEFPLFFYGQYYLGPLEPLIIAFFWMIFGIKTSTLYFGNIFFSVLFGVSAYFLGKQTKDKMIGLLFMLFVTFPSPYFFKASIMPFGYLIEISFLGNLIFLLSLRSCSKASKDHKTLYYILMGIVSGVGFWTHYTFVYYLVPVCIYLFINETFKSLIKNSIFGLVSFFLAGFPFWFFTFKYNFLTFKFISQPQNIARLPVFIKSLATHISSMLGVNFLSNNVLDFPRLLFFFIYVVCVVFFLINSFSKKKFISNNNLLFVLFFVFIVLFYIGFRSRSYAGESFFYLIPFVTFIGISFSCAMSRLLEYSKMVGLCIVCLVVGFNFFGICKMIVQSRHLSESIGKNINTKIEFLKNNNIYCISGSEFNGRAISFFSNEEIIASGFMNSEYLPYENKVEASPRVAYEKCDNDWSSILNNICKNYKFQNGFYYDFERHKYKESVISPSNWHADASSNKNDVSYAFDRNTDNYWVSKGGRKSGMNFTLDLGNVYTVCKIDIFGGHRYLNDPIECLIQTSNDGIAWSEAERITDIQPLFWSGPRPYWRLVDGRLEWFLKPVSTRFIRFVQIGDDKENPWIIDEIFVYEYIGEQDYKAEDYIKEAEEIIKFLLENNINFAYADFWLSAYIREKTREQIKTLFAYNSYLSLYKDLSREILFNKNICLIVCKADAIELELILKEFEIPFNKTEFIYHNCYSFQFLEKKYESIHSLAWNGISAVKHSLGKYSEWLCGEGKYGKALKYYPNNYLAYLKCNAESLSLNTRFYPQKQKNISFTNGVKFLGYSIRNKKIFPGKTIRMEYFWESPSDVSDDLSVFVHFIKDGKIIFQNDHKFLYQFQWPLQPLTGERFREVLRLEIPEQVEAGVYEIVIGLYEEKKHKRIDVQTARRKRNSKESVGEFIVE